MTQQYSNIIVPSSAEDKKKIRNAMDEISNSMTRIEAERDHIKEIKNKLKEDFSFPSKVINRMAKVHHKRNFTEEQSQNEDFEILYETVNGGTTEDE